MYPAKMGGLPTYMASAGTIVGIALQCKMSESTLHTGHLLGQPVVLAPPLKISGISIDQRKNTRPRVKKVVVW
jgi:hypothetical protein